MKQRDRLQREREAKGSNGGVSECRLATARNAEFLGAKSLVRKAHRKRPAKRK